MEKEKPEMSLKQKLLELKRFRVLTNIESSITKGEKITRKDYVETVKLTDVLVVLDEAAKQIRELMVVADLEHTHPSTEFWRGWNKAIDRVLAVLEGSEMKPK